MCVFEKITYFINKIPKTWRNFEKIPKIFKEVLKSWNNFWGILTKLFGILKKSSLKF